MNSTFSSGLSNLNGFVTSLLSYLSSFLYNIFGYFLNFFGTLICLPFTLINQAIPASFAFSFDAIYVSDDFLKFLNMLNCFVPLEEILMILYVSAALVETVIILLVDVYIFRIVEHIVESFTTSLSSDWLTPF